MADDLTYGTDASRFVGAGIDYAQTRPFAYGDNVRSIDWKVTARTGRFHVKEYEATKRSPLFVLVDTSASMALSSLGPGRPSKHDLAVWLGAALALVGLRRRSPVSILSCGERDTGAEGAPTLSTGRVWRRIEQLRAPSRNEATTLSRQVVRVESLALHTSMVIVLSDMHEAGAVEAIKRLGQRHDAMVIQLRDPAEDAPLRAGFVRAQEAETGREFMLPRGGLRGDDLRAQLVGAGVDHLLLRTDEPAIPAVRRMLALRGGGGRRGAR
ncbi:MAG: DUF58 domain-containing protein [Phycisphaeraceae bacterium]|nr:DUF58 domain-containing protein [Phycisphaeraceae bacterium]